LIVSLIQIFEIGTRAGRNGTVKLFDIMFLGERTAADGLVKG